MRGGVEGGFLKRCLVKLPFHCGMELLIEELNGFLVKPS